MTDPVVKQIQASIGSRARAGMGAIGGYTNQLGQVLGGLAQTAGDPYRQAQQGQAASDSALMQAVTGAGNDQAQQLAAKLAQIGAPQAAVDATSGVVGQNAQGAGAALYGQGSASLSELLGREASARDYAGKQQGIGGLAGLQAGRDLQLSATKDFADQAGAVRARVPDVISQALTNINASRETARQDAFAHDVAVQGGLIKGADARLSAAQREADRRSRERIAGAQIAARRDAQAQTAAGKRAAAVQKAADAKTQARSKAFYAARSGAFKDAAAAFGAGRSAAQVAAALRAKYGRLLAGYGFDEQAISRMIGSAVRAGKATPTVTKGSASSSGSLVP
jgi:hypothetical protein